MIKNDSQEASLKWREVYSLAALNAAVVISWIAYHEYQPTLIQKFNFDSLAEFLVVAKAIILVLIPAFAGWLADKLINRSGKYFIVFSVGVGATAMVFMTVATIIAAGPLSAIKPFLPIMIVIWLVAMNLFISPANSMIEAFAPAQKLPVVMGVLFLTTELLYALEPVIVSLVHFFGDTLTFVVGGILISGTGYLFHRVSSDEVIQRKREQTNQKHDSLKISALVAIILVGIELGIGKAFLVEFLPNHFASNFSEIGESAEIISFGLLGFSAILGFIISKYVNKLGIQRVLLISFIALIIGVAGLILSPNYILAISFAVIIAICFSFVNISGLPFVFQNIPSKYVTYGVGVFLGASEILTGIFEYYYH
jgi:MFS family permease